MEQFEEYSDAIRCNEIECGDNMILCRDLSCKECMKIRKEAWRAALEWFRERTYNFDHAWAIQIVIDEELEE